MTKVRIKDVQMAFEEHAYPAPMKFRATVVDRVTLLNLVACIENERVESVKGFGSMPLGNVWAFPSHGDYVVECFARVLEGSTPAFDRIQYPEQPTARDLYAPGTPDMRKAASIKPVLIDESLTGYASLLRARELGYSGVALKGCKGQSSALAHGRVRA